MNCFAIIFGALPISKAEVISSRVIRRYQFYKYFFIDFGKSVYCSRVFRIRQKPVQGVQLPSQPTWLTITTITRPNRKFNFGSGRGSESGGGGEGGEDSRDLRFYIWFLVPLFKLHVKTLHPLIAILKSFEHA